MPKRVKFTKRQFEHLFEKIQERFIGGVDLQVVRANSSKFFGFSTNNPYLKDEGGEPSGFGQDSLKKVLWDDPEIARFLSREGLKRQDFNGQNLYNKFIEVFDNQAESCAIEEPYATAYILYAGFKDVNAFLSEAPQDRSVRAQRPMTVLKAFYWSYRRNSIREFQLRCDFSSAPFYIEQTGYHDSIREPVYKGEGKLVDGKIQVTLIDKESRDEMKITINSGDNPLSSEAMLGSVMAVSAHEERSPVCFEVLLVNKSGPLDPEDELRIKRFLFLHRRNFRVKNIAVNLRNLQAKRRAVDVLSGMVAYYRCWRFDEQFEHLLSSVFYLAEDYKAYCYTAHHRRNNLNRQVCLLDLLYDDESNKSTLCVSTHPDQGADLLSSLYIEIIRERHELTGGVMCISGEDHPYMRSIALLKEPGLPKANTEAEILANVEKIGFKKIPVADIEKEITGNPRLQMLWEKLLEIERQNQVPKALRKWL